MDLAYEVIMNNDSEETNEPDLPENFNRTEDIWVAVYQEGDSQYAEVLSHKYPIQSEVIDQIKEEYSLIEPKTEGIYIISGSCWSSYDEWNGDYDAGFDISEESIIYDSSKSLIECDVDEYQIIFLSFRGGDNVIFKANDELWDLPEDRLSRIFDFVYGYNAEKDGVYNLIIRPSGYGGEVSQRVATVKVIDIPEGEERW